LPKETTNQSIHKVSNPEGMDPLHRNLSFHQVLTRGFDLKYKVAGKEDERYEHIFLVDWNYPEHNNYWVANQLPIKGQNDTRLIW
jgi:type I restriction enzyme, R subunit